MKKIGLTLLICGALAACGIGDTNTTYDRHEIGEQARVELGRILQISPIKTSGTNTIGTLTGAGAGAAAGSMIGGNTAVNIIGGVGGALIGGMIGSAAEKNLTSDTAYEFLIQKQNGSLISVVQSNELGLRAGENVLLSTLNGTTRIRARSADLGL